MKNIFRIGKRSIAAILTLCVLFSIVGTGVYAVSVMPEETTTTEDASTVTEETTQELVPMMAQRCASTYYIINLSTNYMTATTYDGAISALKAGKSVWVADANTAGLLANELGYYYDWGAPHQNGPYQYYHYQDGNGSHICYGNLL